MPRRSENPPPLHASNTPEALEHLPPVVLRWDQRSFPLPRGIPQLNGGPAPGLPAHPFIHDQQLLADLPLARIVRQPMTALPPACPRARPNGERIGGEREVMWERDQERRAWEHRAMAMRPLLGEAARTQVGDSPWSSLMGALSDVDDIELISLFSSPASPVPRPPTLLARLRAAFLSLLRLPITLLLRLFPRLFPRPLPSPPAPQYNNLWSDSEYDNPWSDSEYDNPWSDSEDEGSEHDDAHGQV